MADWAVVVSVVQVVMAKVEEGTGVEAVMEKARVEAVMVVEGGVAEGVVVEKLSVVPTVEEGGEGVARVEKARTEGVIME